MPNTIKDTTLTTNTNNQIIAHLIPKNFKAQQAFNDVVQKIKHNRNDEDNVELNLHHANTFMFTTTHRQTNPDSALHATTFNRDCKCKSEYESKSKSNCNCIHQSVIEEKTTEHTETEPDTESEGLNINLKWGGYFVLRFDILPNYPLLGWFIGAGRWDSKSDKRNGGIDLQLAVPKTPYSKYELAGRHARISFDETGSLIVNVVSDRAKIVLGNEEFTSGQRIITQRKNHISFGDLTYSLEYIVNDENEYQQNLKSFFSDYLHRKPPPPDLAATPSPWDTILGDWLVRGTVGKGTFGIVNAAKHRSTGVTGAVKFFTRSQNNMRSIAEEIAGIKALPIHPQLLQFCDELYERDRWFTGVDHEADERYGFKARPDKVALIFKPYSRATFDELLHKMSTPIRLTAFWQILQGVHALHQSGFIHRDLKLQNLGIVDFSPGKNEISTVILDYGQTIITQKCIPTPGAIGTIPYLAPEMEIHPYGNQIDIWALGVIGYQMFISTTAQFAWRNIHHDKHLFEAALVTLKRKSMAQTQGMEDLLAKMLVWDPKIRISAKEALEHKCFEKAAGWDCFIRNSKMRLGVECKAGSRSGFEEKRGRPLSDDENSKR